MHHSAIAAAAMATAVELYHQASDPYDVPLEMYEHDETGLFANPNRLYDLYRQQPGMSAETLARAYYAALGWRWPYVAFNRMAVRERMLFVAFRSEALWLDAEYEPDPEPEEG